MIDESPHYPVLVSYLRDMGVPSQEWDDMLQEAWLALYLEGAENPEDSDLNEWKQQLSYYAGKHYREQRRLVQL